MMNRKGSGILGHPLTGAALRADPAAGGDGFLWCGAVRSIRPSNVLARLLTGRPVLRSVDDESRGSGILGHPLTGRRSAPIRRRVVTVSFGVALCAESTHGRRLAGFSRLVGRGRRQRFPAPGFQLRTEMQGMPAAPVVLSLR
jgi:hypothetical protein